MRARVFPRQRELGSFDAEKAFIGLSLNNGMLKCDSHLLRTFDWTSGRVGQFDLLIGDYVNRHNYEVFGGLSPAEAIARSVEEGHTAQARLLTLVPGLVRDQAISSFSLFERDDFESKLSHFEDLYSNNSGIKYLIDKGVKQYLDRKHPLTKSDPLVRNHCIAYQLEELVMFEMLAEKGHRVFVYAGPQLPVMKSIVSGHFEGVSKELMQLTLIELRQI